MKSQKNNYEKYDVFLSYRRDGGETMSILLRDRLLAMGYRVFLDIESLNSGSFNEKLLSVIEGCTDVIVVCSQNSLDRCANENDWMRTEIAHALRHRKNIVPVMLRGFEWPDDLPGDMEALKTQNGVNAGSNEYFDAVIDRLAEKFLLSVPATIQQDPAKASSKNTRVMFAAVICGALLIALAIIGVTLFLNNDLNTPDNGSNALENTNQSTDIAVGDPDSSETGGIIDGDPGPADSNPVHTPTAQPETTTAAQEAQPGASTATPSSPPEEALPPPASAIKEPAPTPPQTASQPPEVVIDSITIKGTQYSTSLFELDLSNMDLSNGDIVPLKNMKYLEILSLGGNQISDLSPLSGLTGLKQLSLYDNTRISNLTPLSNLKNLTRLSLYYNQISDLTPLSNLTNLEWLELTGNQISDISPLGTLVNLSWVGLRENQIDDWSPVAHVPQVTGRPAS